MIASARLAWLYRPSCLSDQEAHQKLAKGQLAAHHIAMRLFDIQQTALAHFTNEHILCARHRHRRSYPIFPSPQLLALQFECRPPQVKPQLFFIDALDFSTSPFLQLKYDRPVMLTSWIMPQQHQVAKFTATRFAVHLEFHIRLLMDISRALNCLRIAYHNPAELWRNMQ